MNASTEPAAAPQQGDRLLWLAAGVVAAIGLTWLLMSKPWSSSSAPSQPQTASTPATAAPADAAPEPATSRPERRSGPEGRLDNPLRKAQLAYEAGMLVEPEDYSAWTLFARVLSDDPDSADAKAGLEAVSETLIRRADVALEQGRFNDAQASVERILAVLPEYAGALELAAEIERIRPKPAPEPEPAPPARPSAPERSEPESRAAVAANVRAAPPPPPPVDPVPELHEAFSTAMRENRLLTPPGDNAKAHVEAMLAANASHELTRAAQDLLSSELLARSTQALEALDPEAARSWIDATDGIASSPTAVASARAELNARLIELESAKPLPASSLEIASYVAPEYPNRALQRAIEGWVDVEFTVGADGSVREVRVAEASHDRMFHDEAIEAVSQWRFEPRIFMDQAIAQRSYTRIRFAFE